MKKVVFGIFAHPDDEAFGPCGTLVKEVSEGTELHLFALTCGESGQNPDSLPNLGEVREAEWRQAGAQIGASSMHALHRPDGHLDNIAMQAICHEIEPVIRDIIAGNHEPVAVEFMTLDPNGLTGHIDHIVAARAASFLFYRLQRDALPVQRIRYYCHTDAHSPASNVDWIYAEKGRAETEINEIVDAREHRDKIIAIMQQHRTQRQDYETVLANKGEHLGLEHFLIRN